MIQIDDVLDAHRRIQPYINKTPLLTSTLLNHWLGHHIVFKVECLQKVGAFKARGGCNSVAKLIEDKKKPKRIIASSSGNHAQAIAWASRQFGIPATIYMPKQASRIKAQATAAYGAEIVFGESRRSIDKLVETAAQTEGTAWIPPFNHRDVIAGQGTAALEALSEMGEVDAVFAPCGGGGLLSGTLIASRRAAPGAKVIGVEPANANDAAQSLKKGKIQILPQSPNTVADGAMTLSVGELTFEYLKQLDEFYEVDETNIIYWTQWLCHLLKLHVEPTSAMVMDAVCRWVGKHKSPQKVLVILSGGNIDQSSNKLLWEDDHLSLEPYVKYGG